MRPEGKSPCPEAGAGIETPLNLERQLGCQLNATRAASSEERVADAHIARGRDRIESLAHFASPTRAQAESIEGRISNERRQKRIGEVRMVQDVEKIGPQLQTHAL